MIRGMVEALSSVVFAARDRSGASKNFVKVDDFERWARGRSGIVVTVAEPTSVSAKALAN